MHRFFIAINSLRRYGAVVVTLLMVVAMVVHAGVVSAQTAADMMNGGNRDILGTGNNDNNLYGGNPYEQDDQEGEDGEEQSETDSVETREVKPMESYFFDDETRAMDNFAWSVDRDFNRINMQKIDTTLTDWRIDYPYYRKGVGDMTLGGLGQATQPINYYDRAKYYNFKFAQSFDSYTYNVENAPFYNVKKPLTIMSYGESGQKRYREANFGILHAMNISPSTGFAVDYKSRGTKGLYQQQDTKNQNLAVTFSHSGKHYSLHAGYINNTITTEENGGVVGAWSVRDSIFDMPVVIPVKLGEEAAAGNKYRNNTLFIKQSYGVSLEPMDEYDFTMADKSAIYVGHTLEYSTWSKVYRDKRSTYIDDRHSIDSNGNYQSAELEYYDDWFIDAEQSRDSIRERVMSNRFYVQAQPWDRNGIVGVLDGGIGLDLTAYSQFELGDYLSGQYSTERRADWFAYGAVKGKFRRYLDWDGEVKIYPSGERAGDMMARADIALKAYVRNKPLVLSAGAKVALRSPSYWDENLFSNHYVFRDPLRKENETRLHAELKIPDFNLELGVSEAIVDDLIYYDADSRVAQASTVSLTSIYARKKFVLGGLNLDHRVLAQLTTDDVAAPVPDFSAYLSYYYEFWVVRNVLRLQIGLDGRYTSKYYMPDYNPALSTFYNQRSEELGSYPYVDAYVAGKWKRMRLMVKYQHLNDGLFGNNEYFSMANYPMNPGMFKIGFSWGFYD